MRLIVFILFIIGLTSCGITNTSYDYDEQQDFLVYKTYAFYPEMNSGLSELDHKRLIQVTEKVMEVMGFVKSETPDIYINFKTTTVKAPSRNSIGVGLGGGGGGGVNIGIGGSIPIGGPETYLELTTDFVDTKRDELVWQAIAEKRFNPNGSPNAHTDFFRRIIEKSLSKYPPKKKK
ncbi:DUF4136 domain-containing protein [Aquimarina algiphila]|uniref:DUF4136 domain-containing protein n=1 Tax=Aquimarina algiphila TaxID=2047982 RepID=UPI00232CACCE|nr:DUF4136 domain-containing protein [Aquimarina algiphila]